MEVEGAVFWPKRRPLPTLVEASDAPSSSRKRTRFSPPPRDLLEDNSNDDELEISDEDDEVDGGDEEVDEDDEEEVSGDEEEVNEDEEEEDEVDGDDEEVDEDDEEEVTGDEEEVTGDEEEVNEDEEEEVDGDEGYAGDAAEDQQAAEEEDSDDEIPISRLPRLRSIVPPAPAPAEEDSDDYGPIRFRRDVNRPIRFSSGPRTAVRPGPTTTAPSPAAPAPPVAPLAPPPEPSPSSCSDSLIRDATVEKNGGIDCSICYLPLKPPIFQCNIGHVVCCRCSDKVKEGTNCHMCRAPTPGGYRRCYDMEKLVDSIRVPCPHAAHGCAARPAYHGREDHARACPHAPCHCPGEACGFAGTTAALVDHLAAAHTAWPCTAVDEGGAGAGVTTVFLQDGFNFLTATVRPAAAAAMNKYLFLLNFERAPPFGRAITAFCVHPDRTATAKLKLTYHGYMCNDMCSMHVQTSEFKVVCTDLSNGLPHPSSNCFMFVVPTSDRYVQGGVLTRVSVTLLPRNQ